MDGDPAAVDHIVASMEPLPEERSDVRAAISDPAAILRASMEPLPEERSDPAGHHPVLVLHAASMEPLPEERSDPAPEKKAFGK